jgi:zinc protease
VRHRSAEEIARPAGGPRQVPLTASDLPSLQLSMVDTQLSGDLRVVAVHKPGVPMAEVRLQIPCTATTARERAALAVMAGTMFADDASLAPIGGDIEVTIHPDRLAVTASALSSGLTVLLRSLARSLTDAGCDDETFARERDRAAGRATMAGADPEAVAWAALRQRQFGDHPAAIEIADVGQLTTITAAEVRALHAAQVAPHGAVLVIVSDLDPDLAIATSNDTMDHLTGERVTEVPPLSNPVGGGVHWVTRHGSGQAQIRIYAPGLHRADPGFAAMELANLVFGGYFSSRLVENLRERNGFAYLVDAQPDLYGPTAALVIRADTTADVATAALEEIDHELARLRTAPLTDEEIDAARRYASGALIASVSSQLGLATQIAEIVWYGLGADWLTTHLAQLATVPAEVVRAAALRHLADARFAGVVLSDA